MAEKYLTVDQIAEITGLTKRTVWKYCRNGTIKATKPTGKAYFVREEDFKAFMDRDTREKRGEK